MLIMALRTNNCLILVFKKEIVMAASQSYRLLTLNSFSQCVFQDNKMNDRGSKRKLKKREEEIAFEIDFCFLTSILFALPIPVIPYFFFF